MMTIPHNHRILDEGSMDGIYRNALRVLSHIGVACGHRKTADLLTACTHARWIDGRLHLDEADVEAFFHKRRSARAAEIQAAAGGLSVAGGQGGADRQAAVGAQVTAGGHGGADSQGAARAVHDFVPTTHWHSWNICDPLTNQPRPASEAEAIDMARLVEALGCRDSPVPLVDGSTPLRLHSLEAERIGLIYTRSHGGMLTATDSYEIEIMKDMNRAAGRRYKLALEGMISPLRLNPEVFDAWFNHGADPDLDVIIFAAIPMAGATTSLSLSASLAQVLAEALAQDFIYDRISDGRIEAFTLRLEPFDMRHANIVFGSPEWCLFKQAVVELTRGLFGDIRISGNFRSNSRSVDAQAMLERTASFLWQAALGIRRFGGLGQLCVDEVWSPVQAVMDLEIMNYARRLYRGLNTIDTDGIDIITEIKEGIAAGSFLGLDSTAALFKDVFDLGSLSSALNLNGWLAAGSPCIEAMAWDRARRIIREYQYELPEAQRRDVEKIYKQGAGRLAGC
jgi:trimethylamine:corrinoid methyltransferase-like protein